uniref:Putative glycosyltransferase n=1 Tax=viral metagenome TaxID=1070528 RepID=A0A6M3IXR4_9ZZZZ
MKVSVVMPVFNTRAYFLLLAVQSVLRQTYTPLELIIVNDGNTSKETIRQLESIACYAEIGYSLVPIRIINQENKKISGALNAGIRDMTGDWWAGCASDDVWYPDKLKEQVAFIEQHPEARVLYCDWDFIDNKGNQLRTYQEPGFKDRMEAGRYIINDYFGNWSGMMIHHEVFNDIGLFNEDYPTREDFEMNIRILTKYMMHRVPKTLFGYRVHGQQLTNTAKKEMQNKYRIMARNLAIEYFGDK